MKPARIMLIATALVAGGLAAFLFTQRAKPTVVETTTVEVKQEQRKQILVATAPIGVGQRLSSTLVEWVDWPEGSVRPEYVVSETTPNAIDDISGAVARFEFFAGEPIREQKLVRSDQGYLSAVLEQGMRGVSIAVTPTSGAGGFIIPNDHVDVVVSKSGETGEISETILNNVKVLAIGKRLGEVGATGADPDAGEGDAAGKGFANDTIATLQLEPYQAETVINAAAIGEISLVLRSIVDFSAPATEERRSNQAVNVIRAGKQASVMTGASALSLPDGSTAQQASFTTEIAAEPFVQAQPVATELPAVR